MSLGDWYRKKAVDDNKVGQCRGFVWDVADGIVELRNYNTNQLVNDGAKIYRLTPADLKAKWTLERKNDSGQIVNPKHLRAEVQSCPE